MGPKVKPYWLGSGLMVEVVEHKQVKLGNMISIHFTLHEAHGIVYHVKGNGWSPSSFKTHIGNVLDSNIYISLLLRKGRVWGVELLSSHCNWWVGVESRGIANSQTNLGRFGGAILSMR